jgi:hypothetical protein
MPIYDEFKVIYDKMGMPWIKRFFVVLVSLVLPCCLTCAGDPSLFW